MNKIPGANGPQTEVQGGTEVSPWIKLAKDAYSRSTSYFENNYKKQFEDNLRLFQSKHPRDSKYNSDAYKYRSKLFRPKTRSVVRKNEATAALAFFANPDVLAIDPVNDEDQMQAWSAAVTKEVMNYRLTKTIPWFITLIGGYQDAMTVGLVCSMQVWRFKQKMVKQTAIGFSEELGEAEVEIEVPKVLVDKPEVNLIPIENVRFDPASHWFDVVGTSPYLIVQIPMYVNDVLDNMEGEDRDGHTWKKLTKAEILKARVDSMDPLRQARNDNREDQNNVQSEVNEFDVVMVHLNFIKSGDTTYAYYTLKDQKLLSEPMPVEEMFLHCKDGRPPVVIGFCVIETHKPVPTSKVGLTAPLQAETNEIGNQRSDNVKFVLNKRWFIRRGANVDVESLMRNVPGGGTLVNDVERDIKTVEWNDVTSSSFQEQDRVSLDFDDLAGNFSQSSVMTNRKLNETVGGMRMLGQGANMITEYDLTVFRETWVEPVLNMLVKMEQAYETDEVVLAIAGQKSGFFQRFGKDAPMDSLLTQQLTLSVSVGMGATDPDSRLQKFMQTLLAYNKIAMEGAPDQNLPEIRKTMFGLAGWKDSARFFHKDIDPMILKAMEVAKSAEAQARAMIEQAKDKLISKEMQLQDREHKLDMEIMEAQNEFGLEAKRAQQEFVISVQKQLNDQVLQADKHRNQMAMERDKAAQQASLQRDKANLDASIKVFEAQLDAALAKMQAEVDRKVALAAMPRKKTAEKKNGKWEITEH